MTLNGLDLIVTGFTNEFKRLEIVFKAINHSAHGNKFHEDF